MPKVITNPNRQFSAFVRAMCSFSSFTRHDVPGTNYYDWEHNGMHDPPVKSRIYSKVERRIEFETGYSENGILLQLDLLRRPKGVQLAAVYLRSKDYPKRSKNTANATFKFQWDNVAGGYVVSFNSPAVKRRLAQTHLLPCWIKTVPGRTNMVLVGQNIDSALIHCLILLADYAGQCAHLHSIRLRDPATFYPPKRNRPSN